MLKIFKIQDAGAIVVYRNVIQIELQQSPSRAVLSLQTDLSELAPAKDSTMHLAEGCFCLLFYGGLL